MTKASHFSKSTKSWDPAFSQHNRALGEKDNAIPRQVRGALSVDEFCDLSKLPDIDDQTQKAERKLMAASNLEAVRSTPLFDTIELPGFDIKAIQQTMLTDLPDLERAAEAQVQAHVHALGEGGESWVAEGFRHCAAR